MAAKVLGGTLRLNSINENGSEWEIIEHKGMFKPTGRMKIVCDRNATEDMVGDRDYEKKEKNVLNARAGEYIRIAIW